MRKQIVGPGLEATWSKQNTSADSETWLNLEALAQIEVSSEDTQHPVEHALLPLRDGKGWRASSAGPQSILIRFDEPQVIRHIFLRFVEKEYERSQEFSLRWTGTETGTGKVQSGEVVRQQWSFSPGGATIEEENYTVATPPIGTLRLEIDPDRGRNRYPATLAALRLR